jgi:hypothetical protein
MTKGKRVLEEAREIKNPELDLVEKGILAFEELPGLCELFLLSLKLSLKQLKLTNS